jgi:hypothetical protein
MVIMIPLNCAIKIKPAEPRKAKLRPPEGLSL